MSATIPLMLAVVTTNDGTSDVVWLIVGVLAIIALLIYIVGRFR